MPAINVKFSRLQKIKTFLTNSDSIYFQSARLSFFVFLFQSLFLSFQSFAVDPTLVIHWTTSTIAGDPELLKDRNGNPLSSGAGGNGNGHVVSLGYFDQATNDSLANHFKGNWVSMTSGTRIGDASSGYGFSDGMFQFTTIFQKFSNQVVIYPNEPSSYTVTAPFSITSTAPSPGTPICIRFYDGTEINPSARYNTVTGTGWEWPSFSSSIPENLYLKIASGNAPLYSDWKYGGYFEDPDNNFTAAKELQSILTVNIDGQGTTNSLNPTYNYGEVVNIEANASAHMQFVEWLGSGVSQRYQPQTTVTMTADRNITAVFQPKSYNLTISSQGPGSTTGAGLYTYGTSVNISATPGNGYQFSHWLGYGPDSNQSNTTLTIQQDHAIEAVFSALTSTLSVSAGTGGSAEVQETGPYYFDGNYTIIATPASGYTFTDWTGTSSALQMLESNISEISTLVLTGTASYQANFQLNMRQLEVLMGEGGQTVSPATGTHSELSMVQVNASPVTGYQFTKWEDPSGILIDPLSAATEANMSIGGGNVTITATFSKITYPVVINEGSGGNVSLSPANGPWEHGEVYDLLAVAQTGYTFLNWTGDQNSTNSLRSGLSEPTNKVGVISPIELTANFSKNQYFVQVQSSTGGSTTGSGTYTIDDNPSIQALPESGWQFSNWTGDLTYLLAQNASSSLVQLTTAPLSLSYTANFSRQIYAFEVAVEGQGLVNNQTGFTLNPDSNTAVSLIATPSTGSHFTRWYGYEVNDPESSSLSFIPTSAGKITALFDLNQIQLVVNQSEGGEANGTGTYSYGSTVSISSTPSPGYVFEQWTGDTQFLSDTSSSPSLTIPDQNLTLNAIFKPIPFSVSVSSTGVGTVSGGGTYDSGNNVSLSAQPGGIDNTAARGHQLEKWTWTKSDGTSGSSTVNPFQFIVDTNYSVVAKFSPIPPDHVQFNLVSNPTDGGILFDDPDLRTWNIATDSIDRTILATPHSGFSFLGWKSSENLSFAPTWKSPQVVASPSANSTITSYFSPVTHKLILSFDATRGSATGNGLTLPSLVNTSISTTANNNYEFSEWIIKDDISYEITRKSSLVESSGTKIFIDGIESPALTLIRGFTYTFNCSLSGGDLFYLSTSPSGSFVGEYLNGVSNSRASSGVLTITVPADAPDTLYYHGSGDDYSGNKIKVVTKTTDQILPYPNNPSIQTYLEHDLHLEAKFVGKQFALNFVAGEGGTISSPSSALSATYGSTITLSAVPLEHYEFVRWEGSAGITNPLSANTSLLVSEAASIRSVYKPTLYNLNFVLTPSTGGNAFTTDNQYLFTHGSRVPIQVTPLVGNEFVQWSGNVEDRYSTSTHVSILGDTSVSVQFSETLIAISKVVKTLDANNSLMNQTGGSIVGGSSFALGSTPNFKATPSEGFEFVRWESETGTSFSTTANAQIQITGFSTVIGVFKQISHAVELSTSPSGKGRIEWTNTGTGESLSANVPHGQTLVLRAIPSEGYYFEKWTNSAGDLYKTGTVDLSVTIEKPMLINARFAPVNPIELTITANPEIAGWTFGQGIFSHSSDHSIFAKPNPGYLFDYWEGVGISNTQLANSNIALDQNSSIVAHFKIDPTYDLSENPVINELGLYNLAIVSSNNSYGTVAGSGIFGTGWAEIKAYPKEGFEFVSWEGAEVESQNLETTVIFLSKDESITAVFREKAESIVKGSNQLEGGWWSSEWFGLFWNVNQSWSYHEDLGWINIASVNDDSNWVWIQRLNSWCWTRKSAFPYFFLQNQQQWIWIDLKNSNFSGISYFLFNPNSEAGTWYNQ